ncbi:MAG: hypothetical protein R3A46_16195 [Thermomicrobiales bacterium]
MSRSRNYAQIAAAIAGFGLLTLVLIAVFRGFGDESPAAVGSGDAHPPQLAVTMQTDPINGNPDIFLVGLDGSEPINLTNNPANDTFPAWSPDGSQIAFVSDRGGADALYLMDADGKNIREVHSPSIEDDLHLRYPSWSPDGRSIALKRFDAGSVAGGSLSGVVVIDVDSRDWRQVESLENYPAPGSTDAPAWSPDSRLLMFVVYDETDSRLVIADTSVPDEERRLLSILASTPGDGASWSTADEIAISGDGEIRIVRFVPETATFEDIHQFTSDGSSPVWSADGSSLAFATSTMSGSTLWISDSLGNEVTQVPDSFTGAFPVWSPEERKLAFLRFGALFSGNSIGYELMLYDVVSGSLTNLVDTGFSGPLMSPPAWRPGEILQADDEAKPTATVVSTATEVAPPTPTSITPTPAGEPSNLMIPPQARLRDGSTLVDGYLGS